MVEEGRRERVCGSCGEKRKKRSVVADATARQMQTRHLLQDRHLHRAPTRSHCARSQGEKGDSFRGLGVVQDKTNGKLVCFGILEDAGPGKILVDCDFIFAQFCNSAVNTFPQIQNIKPTFGFFTTKSLEISTIPARKCLTSRRLCNMRNAQELKERFSRN